MYNSQPKSEVKHLKAQQELSVFQALWATLSTRIHHPVLPYQRGQHSQKYQSLKTTGAVYHMATTSDTEHINSVYLSVL